MNIPIQIIKVNKFDLSKDITTIILQKFQPVIIRRIGLDTQMFILIFRLNLELQCTLSPQMGTKLLNILIQVPIYHPSEKKKYPYTIVFQDTPFFHMHFIKQFLSTFEYFNTLWFLRFCYDGKIMAWCSKWKQKKNMSLRSQFNSLSV